jgi:3-oxoacyl-[acyl-carrier-protein] synthase II
MARRVVITGSGILCPLGDSPAAVEAALVEVRDCSGDVELPPAPETVGGPAVQLKGFAAEAYLGDRNLRPLDGIARLLTCAAGLALADSGWSPALLQAEEVGLVVGTTFSSVRTTAEFDRRAQREGPCYASPMDFANTVLNAPAGQAAIWHGLRGVNSTMATGATAGLQGIAHATDLIRAGRARALLAGGVEELSYELFLGFAESGLLADGPPLPFDARRKGFVLGEGAALLMLEDAESAAARGARVLAEVRGHGSRFDSFQGSETESADRTIAAAVRLALREAGVTTADLDAVSAAANGSVDGDRAEAKALAAVFGGCRHGPAVTAPKALFGEALGASGALQAVALVEALRTGRLPGTPGLRDVEEPFLRERIGVAPRAVGIHSGLVNAVGHDGHCCAVVFAAPGADT